MSSSLTFFGVICLAFLAIFVASGVGMGGGGILVPLFSLMLSLPSTSAVPLSNITIFGGSIVNVISYIKRKHPKAPRPLIDWDLILVMEPVTILGALAGSFINKLLPGWITSIFLVLVLSATTYRLMRKATKLFRQESEEAREAIDRKASDASDLDENLSGDIKPDEEDDVEDELAGTSLQISIDGVEDEKVSVSAAPLSAPSGKWPERHVPSNSPLSFFARLFTPRLLRENMRRSSLLVPQAERLELRPGSADVKEEKSASSEEKEIVETGELGGGELEVNALKDDKKAKVFPLEDLSLENNGRLSQILKNESQVPPWWKVGAVCTVFVTVLALTIARGTLRCGSPGYFLVVFVNVPIVGTVMYCIRHYLVNKHQEKECSGYVYLPGDVRWNERATVVYPAICTVAGVFAGMFGIGGGIVKQPLMLEMNVLPEVAVATSSVMIFFTTGAATMSYMSFGLLAPGYAIPFFLVGFVATIGGNLIMRFILRKFQRKSLILFAVAGVIAVSTILMALASIRATIEGKNRASLCGTLAE
eukprot:CAMPEP_0184489194 /NCGR_PEP_ID=MMETSP0113_2-20130426/14740_1 /TAXON_ID=91329 /ORGANISM="Norrisiella sphaerica, Strain BC52" /LENGTH=534 /DNA_ID=CAMNT_0026872471 /DNA_START=171 /DNA_END=1775 /DNA_ORIENTATION=-